MSNTIALLESIGRDASLRHASGENLLQALNGMDAGESLKRAAASGDRSHLAGEFGSKSNKVNHNVHDGGCEPGDDEAEKAPGPDDGGKDESDASARQT